MKSNTNISLCIAILAFIVLSTSSFTTKKKFPEFSYEDQFGDTITQQHLLGKKTLLVHFHLGCPGAAGAITDFNYLYEALDHSKYQLIGILENSPKQMQDFFSDEETIWSGIKTQLSPQDPPKFSLLAECEVGKYIRDDQGEIIAIDKTCRKISKKLNSRSCPLIYWIDEEGVIQNKKDGYTYLVPKESFGERKALLMERFDW